jgi:hypothetical protein
MKHVAMIGLVGASLFSFGAFAQDPVSEPTSGPTKRPPEEPAPEPEEEEEASVSYGFETDAQAFYLWRGIPLSSPGDNQPYAWVDVKGLEIGVYANQVLNPADGTPGSINEVGLVLLYPRDIGPIYFEPQIQAYFYPNFKEDGPPTAEAYFKVGYPIGPVTPFVTPIIDFVSNLGGAYLEAGVEHSSEPWTDAELYASLSVGTASGKFNSFNIDDEALGGAFDFASVNALTAQFYLEFPVWGSIYVRPHVEVAALLNSTIKEELGVGVVPNVGFAIGFAP